MFRISLILLLVWLPSFILTSFDKDLSFFYLRHQLTILTGILALGYMTLAMVLALRVPMVEKWVHGLDKGYALHKRLGIFSTIALVLHWLTIKSAHWLIQLQWIDRPHRGPRPEIQGINWHSVGEQIGEISFYAFLIFATISLLQAVGYKTFKFTHKIAGIIFILAALHAFMLLDDNLYALPENIAIYLMGGIGIISAIWSLSNRIGSSKKASGQVMSVQHFTDPKTKSAVIKIKIKLNKEIDYKNGQFAFINFSDGESPHPFSIFNYDRKTNEIEFAIKALGDYTEQLMQKLNKGHQVTVEGGYGHFQTENEEFQAWVGAGIGIVPFISRLNALNNQPELHKGIKKIQLYYCTDSVNDAFFKSELQSLITHLPFVELHCVESGKGDFLQAEHIHLNMTYPAYKVSFCGPKNFGDALEDKFADLGIGTGSFSREIFTLR